MLRIKLTVEYDGSNYFGWQFQKGQITIQEAIEKALFIIFKLPIRITGSGRTDAGVHARNQVVHLDVPACDLKKMKNSLNGILKNDIRIKEIKEMHENFHARFDAVARKYCYYISQKPTSINRNYAWQMFYPLNLTLMQAGAEIIKSTTDFRAFCKIKSEVKHYLCEIQKCTWIFKNELLILEIVANRFLHGMVRAVTGTLVDLGRGKITVNELENIIKSRDRTKLQTTAPACGLVLENVFY
jgi:tRNA pseudouridine38-40 synthase